MEFYKIIAQTYALKVNVCIIPISMEKLCMLLSVKTDIDSLFFFHFASSWLINKM